MLIETHEEYKCARAIILGDIEYLKNRHNRKFKWNYNEEELPVFTKVATLVSVIENKLDILTFLISVKTPWHEDCLTKAIKDEKYDIIDFALKNECPTGNFYSIINDMDVKMTKFLYKRRYRPFFTSPRCMMNKKSELFLHKKEFGNRECYREDCKQCKTIKSNLIMKYRCRGDNYFIWLDEQLICDLLQALI